MPISFELRPSSTLIPPSNLALRTFSNSGLLRPERAEGTTQNSPPQSAPHSATPRHTAPHLSRAGAERTHSLPPPLPAILHSPSSILVFDSACLRTTFLPPRAKPRQTTPPRQNSQPKPPPTLAVPHPPPP